MAEYAKDELVLSAGGMDLAATLFCGQSFSWRQEEEPPGKPAGFIGVAGGRSVVAAQQGEALLLRRLDGEGFAPEDRAFWYHYFALDCDYTALQNAFCTSKALGRCVLAAPGIRVLRQPFFETLLSFIISQNNHIQRISGIVTRLRELCGPRLPGGEYGFPSPQQLAAFTVEELAPLRAGFRSKYLLDAAQRVVAGQVEEASLRALPDEEARALLCTIKGVGPKVADCVLLFGLGRSHIVPMDVWMNRAMKQLFPRGMPRCAKGNEGIAQQYIFHWARENLDNKK